MASPLEGQIAREIARAFKGRLRKGSLRRAGPSIGLDEMGDPLPGAPLTFRFEGIREDYDAAYRERAGIPATDVRILIIAGSIKTEPRIGDHIYLQLAWYRVRAIEEIDPAAATFTLQCHGIQDPTT